MENRPEICNFCSRALELHTPAGHAYCDVGVALTNCPHYTDGLHDGPSCPCGTVHIRRLYPDTAKGWVDATSIAGDEEREGNGAWITRASLEAAEKGVSLVNCDTNAGHHRAPHVEDDRCQNARPYDTSTSLEGVAVACRYPSLPHAGRHVWSEQCAAPEALDTFAPPRPMHPDLPPAQRIDDAPTAFEVTTGHEEFAVAGCGCIAVLDPAGEPALTDADCKYVDFVKPNAEICGVIRREKGKPFIMCLGQPDHSHGDVLSDDEAEWFIKVPSHLVDTSNRAGYQMRRVLTLKATL